MSELWALIFLCFLGSGTETKSTIETISGTQSKCEIKKISDPNETRDRNHMRMRQQIRDPNEIHNRSNIRMELRLIEYDCVFVRALSENPSSLALCANILVYSVLR